MSTRWYRIYQRGNPQRRVYLPNFQMKIIKNDVETLPNVVTFACSQQMTFYDIRNYLEKIYNIPVVHVRIRIAMGQTRELPLKRYVVKDDDVKIAYVTLPKTEFFKYPDLFPSVDKEIVNYKRVLNEQQKSYKNFLDRNRNKPGVPGWFNF